MSFLGLRMLKNPKKPISKNYNIFEKYLMGGPLEKKLFSFEHRILLWNIRGD